MIIFTKDIPTDKLLLAYQNNVVEFYSDNVLLPTKATVTIGSSIKTLFPSPNGKFYLNFKEWITSLINVDNFKDDLQTDISTSGFVYDWTNKVYLNNVISFNITLSDTTVETITRDVKWLSAYLQLEDYKLKYPISASLINPVVLSPFKDKANQSCYLKYWEGYPFDMTIYTGVSSSILVENLTNLLSETFAISTKVNRLVVDDGDTNLTVTNTLPLMAGFNTLKLTSNSLSYFVNIEKVVDNCDGHYIKWFNEFSGWNYWLFAKGNRNRKTKDLGELANDFNNLEDTISPTVQIGKTSNDVIQVTTDVINSDENTVLQSLLDSPKIYLFTGQPYAKANYNDWLEVSLNTNDVRIVNAKEKLNKFNLTFELPQRNTRTL